MTINQSKPCNRANYGGTRSQTKYLVIHYTSNSSDTANNNATYFNREALARPASAHFFVDESEIWASVPENMIAYHCGASSYKHPYCRNSNSIGIEICMNDRAGNVRYGSIDNAVTLAKAIMTKYGIPVENVLRHYDVTLKNCPAPMVADESLWNDFKERLVEDEMKVYNYVKDMPSWAQESATKAIKKGIIAMDSSGAVNVQECNLQPLVWLDRIGMLDVGE